MADIDGILNYRQVTDQLGTSGQPSAEEFAAIAAAGYEIVVNIAMPDSDNAIEDEGSVVTGLGMRYVHIPVVWESPQVTDLVLFCRLMQVFEREDRKVWVHCAMNMRVSCFVYLYRRWVLGEEEDAARFPMKTLWKPKGVWAELVEAAPEPLGALVD